MNIECTWNVVHSKDILKKLTGITRATYLGAKCYVLHPGKISDEFEDQSGVCPKVAFCRRYYSFALHAALRVRHRRLRLQWWYLLALSFSHAPWWNDSWRIPAKSRFSVCDWSSYFPISINGENLLAALFLLKVHRIRYYQSTFADLFEINKCKYLNIDIKRRLFRVYVASVL